MVIKCTTTTDFGCDILVNGDEIRTFICPAHEIWISRKVIDKILWIINGKDSDFVENILDLMQDVGASRINWEVVRHIVWGVHTDTLYWGSHPFSICIGENVNY